MPLFPPVASEAQTLLAGKRKSLFFFLRGELDTKQPLDRNGSPSLPALLAARGPEWKADAVQKPLQSFATLEEMSRSICVPSVEKTERFASLKG